MTLFFIWNHGANQTCLLYTSDAADDTPCVDSCPKEAIDVKGASDFIFYLESWGQLDGKKILLEATKILDKKLDEFSEKLKQAKLSQ